MREESVPRLLGSMPLTSTSKRLGLGHDLLKLLEALPELQIDFIEPLVKLLEPLVDPLLKLIKPLLHLLQPLVDKPILHSVPNDQQRIWNDTSASRHFRLFRLTWELTFDLLGQRLE
jgi:hypothetical protein